MRRGGKQQEEQMPPVVKKLYLAPVVLSNQKAYSTCSQNKKLPRPGTDRGNYEEEANNKKGEKCLVK